MKRFSTLLTAAAVLLSVQTNAQSYIETFETGTLPACVKLTNAYTSNVNPIYGSTSLTTDPPTNPIGNREYISPNLDVTSTNQSLTISYWYALDVDINSGNLKRTIEIGIIRPDGTRDFINLLTIQKESLNPNLDERIPRQQSVNYTAAAPGLYKIYMLLAGDGGGGTVRAIVDNISVNANPYYSNNCNTPPVAVNDNFISSGAITENVFTNTVGGSDRDDNAGETWTATQLTTVDPLVGTLSFNTTTGIFTFNPTPEFANIGYATFTYSITDNGFAPATSNIATVRIAYTPAPVVLPVKLISFSGSILNNKGSLRWSVADNETGDQFEVLRSADGKNFTEAGIVFINNKVGAESYNFIDPRELYAVTYYKLKIINKDRSITYSNIIALKSATDKPTTTISIMKNPVESTLNFTYAATTASQGQVSIYNSIGVKVYSSRINTQKGTNVVSLNLDSHMAAGTYILEVVNGSERAVARMIKK